MPEDNYLECINVIAQTMQGTSYVGQWYGECWNRKGVMVFRPCRLLPLPFFKYLYNLWLVLTDVMRIWIQTFNYKLNGNSSLPLRKLSLLAFRAWKREGRSGFLVEPVTVRPPVEFSSYWAGGRRGVFLVIFTTFIHICILVDSRWWALTLHVIGHNLYFLPLTPHLWSLQCDLSYFSRMRKLQASVFYWRGKCVKA